MYRHGLLSTDCTAQRRRKKNIYIFSLLSDRGETVLGLKKNLDHEAVSSGERSANLKLLQFRTRYLGSRHGTTSPMGAAGCNCIDFLIGIFSRWGFPRERPVYEYGLLRKAPIRYINDISSISIITRLVTAQPRSKIVASSGVM